MKKKTPAGPRLSSGAVVGWTPEKEAMAYNAEQKYGLPEGTLQGMAFRESQFGKLANRRGSQYQGEFQLGAPLRKAGGVTDTRDFSQTSNAAAKYAAENQSGLAKALGRQPTPQELYMTHQQGLDGGTKILQNPNVPVEKLIGYKFAKANGGLGLTGKQFFDKHSRAFNEGIRRGDDALWNGKPSATPGDQTQLAMRGDAPKDGLSEVMVAAMKQSQPTQVAKSDPPWVKSQETQIASARPLPKSDTLPRINPADRSGPLLPKPGEEPTMLADIVGKGIPNSGMRAPSLNPTLEQPTQLASIGPNDFGRSVPNSGIRAPGLNPALEQPTQLASIGQNDFGRGVPNSGIQSPGFNPKLDQPAPTMLADLVGKNVPPSSMQTPGMNPALEQPTQLASIGKNDFGFGVPNNGMSSPNFNPTLERPTQLAQLAEPASPTRPSPPLRAEEPQMQLTAPTPTPPHRSEFAAPAPVQIAQNSPVVNHMSRRSAPEPMLREPGMNQAPTGGVEGFASQSPVVAMQNQQPQMDGGFNIASLFGDSFTPQQDQFMMADAQPAFGGFGGGDFGGGGMDLGSLFGGMFG